MRHAVDPILLERATRHGFGDRPAPDTRAAARLTTAIQAQDARASRLGIRSRTRDVTDADVRTAIDERAVVRSWFMRTTIHLVDADDVRWLSALLAPAIERRSRKRWLDIGLTPSLLGRCHDALPDILATGPRTRSHIVAALAERGIAVPDADPNSGTHLLVSATARGLLCRAGDAGRDATYTLLDAWLPNAPVGPRGDDALAELARRYFTAFSPATGADFTAWSGLASGRAIDLIRNELAEVDVHGRRGFRLGAVEPVRSLRLLSAYDNFLVGYRHRDEMLAPALRPLVYVGGVIKPTVLVDGRIAGLWKLDRRTGNADLRVTLFDDLSRNHRALLEREADDMSRFLALPISLTQGSN